ILAAGTQDGAIVAWDDKGGAWVTLFAGTKPPVALCFSPDGRRLAWSSEGGEVRVWEVGVGTLSEYGADRPVGALCWGPDGRTLAAGDEDGQVHLLRLENVPRAVKNGAQWVSPGFIRSHP